MAITGKWKTRQQVGYDTARVDGTGWNAVHNTRGGDYGRGVATHETLDTISAAETDQFQADGYDYESDSMNTLFGDNPNHPNWGEDNPRSDIMPPDYPSPGYHVAGVPGGNDLREENDGSIAATVYMKAQQPSALAGYDSKLTQAVEDSVTSDPSQYEIQTSMRQRDTTRSGSQVASGRANAVRASIKSRIPGMRAPKYSGGYRHDEMTPKSQDVIVRPFVLRSAGTNDPDWLTPNAAWQTSPVNRQPPGLPDMGNRSDAPQDSFGYTDEDSVPYV